VKSRCHWLLAFGVAGILVLATGCQQQQGEVPGQGPVDAGIPAVTDPESIDVEHPPTMKELSFVNAGSKINGLMYLADGPGPHATIVLLHGYAGNERNLDLAQAMRRAGYNVLFFNYRGTWGSGGEFSAANGIADVHRALEWLREEAGSEYRVDTDRIALVGHSFGGFLGSIAAAEDPRVDCLGSIAGAQMGMFGRAAAENAEMRAGLTGALGQSMDYEGGPVKATPEPVVQDLIDNVDRYDVAARASEMAGRPLFMVAGERDVEAPMAQHHDPVVAALRAAGAGQLTVVVYEDDHYFGGHRIALAKRLTDWLGSACWSAGISEPTVVPKSPGRES